MKKNVAILSIRTQKDVLADFTLYLIKKISSYLDEIYVIFYDTFDVSSINLNEYKIFGISCEINGSNVERWRYGLEKYCNNPSDYNNIILLDDSVYGPVYSFEDVWRTLESSKCDVWGITNQYIQSSFDSYLEPYFIVFKTRKAIKKLMNSPMLLETDDVLFSKSIRKYGLKTLSFIDVFPLINKDVEESFLLYNSYDLVKRFRCPFIARYVYSLSDKEMQFFGNGYQRVALLDYIKDSYPIDLVYQDLIKQHSMNHLINALGLNYIIEEREIMYKEENNYRDVGIFIYLFYEKDVEYYAEKLLLIPEAIDVFILSPTITDLGIFKKYRDKIEIINVGNRGREWAAYLIEAKEVIRRRGYKYCCFLHDKSFHKNEFPTQAYDFRDLLWDNLLPSKQGIYEIVEILRNNKHIGVLLPPIVKHGSYFKLFMNFWTENYDVTITLANKLGINEGLLKKEETPLSVGSMFWMKVDALEKLFNYEFKREDFDEEPLSIEGTVNHALERIVSYIAQDKMYYSAFIGTKRWYEYDNLLLAEMLRETNRDTQNDFFYDT